MNQVVESVEPAASGGVSQNGELRSRVQRLRLSDGSGPTSRGSLSAVSIFPWILCAVLAGLWAFVGIRSYKNLPPENTTGTPSAATLSPPKDTENAITLEVQGVHRPRPGRLPSARSMSGAN